MNIMTKLKFPLVYYLICKDFIAAHTLFLAGTNYLNSGLLLGRAITASFMQCFTKFFLRMMEEM